MSRSTVTSVWVGGLVLGLIGLELVAMLEYVIWGPSERREGAPSAPPRQA
jgi:hypothetical protein